VQVVEMVEKEVEWPTLIFFMMLFIAVAYLTNSVPGVHGAALWWAPYNTARRNEERVFSSVR